MTKPTPEQRTRWMLRQIRAQYRACVYGLAHSQASLPPCQCCGQAATTATPAGLRCGDCYRKEQAR
jgi:hypothetical protein